eukprot:CAMPEP_0118914082 /NCGR_PEP_ID=MMETSP1166-20130328/14585_1 /TAXON_ID=1104430 /ORGANISM="Chrysoreinhardia sp, Strain CCMP3193" /LENGTH=458 /DNA_ID=CAMNT_0006853649 /DNA_START=142 /DNA_END=1518 /DNA_ORIENTATION=+
MRTLRFSSLTYSTGEKQLPVPPERWADRAFEDYGSKGVVSSADAYERPYVFQEIKSELVEMAERGRDGVSYVGRRIASFAEGATNRLERVSKLKVGASAIVGCGACGGLAAWLALSSLAPVGLVAGAVVGPVFALTSDKVRRRSTVTRFLCAWSRVCAATILAVARTTSGGVWILTSKTKRASRKALGKFTARYGDVVVAARERTGELIDAAAIQRQTAQVVTSVTDAIHDAKIDEKLKSAAQFTSAAWAGVTGTTGPKAEVDDLDIGRRHDDGRYLSEKQQQQQPLLLDPSSSSSLSSSSWGEGKKKLAASSKQHVHHLDSRAPGGRPGSVVVAAPAVVASSAAIGQKQGENHMRRRRPAYYYEEPPRESLVSRFFGKTRRAFANLVPRPAPVAVPQYVVVDDQQPNPYFLAALPALIIIAYDHADDAARLYAFVTRVLAAAYNGAVLEAAAAAAVF